MQVEIWSDVVCPWCYLGAHRFARALADFEHRNRVRVIYRSFDLDPAAAKGAGEPTVDMLARKYGMTPAQAADAQRQMERRAAADGLQFRMDRLRSGNTRDAHRLLHLAGERGQQQELATRLHRAYFTEQRSVFDRPSLLEIATEAGLDPAEVDRVLAGDAYDDAVAADERTAGELGVTGVPFFVIDRRLAVSGAQPVELLARALEQAWAQARTSA